MKNAAGGTTTTKTYGYTYTTSGTSDPGEVTKIASGSNSASFTYNREGDRTACSGSPGAYDPCDGLNSASYTFDGDNRLGRTRSGPA